MTKNPILDELRETRERLLAQAGGTLEGLVSLLQQDENRANREFVLPISREDPCIAGAEPGIATVENPKSLQGGR